MRLAPIVVFVIVVMALPAAAMPTSSLVRVSTWTTAVEVRGLGADDAVQAEALWGEFVAGVPAHASCLLSSPPAVEARPGMAPRAAYAPGSATLYVKPGDLPRLVVFHELGHHLDFTCGASEEVGDEFRAAQGISPSRPWWNHGSPVTWPAEYFANAVAVALGEESRHGVTDEAVALVEEWMGRVEPPVGPPPVAAGDVAASALPRLS